MIYADYAAYTANGGTLLTADTAPAALKRASAAIDVLTFGRINGIGFDALTEYQRNTLSSVCCDLADFQTENDDLIDSPLSAYAINGVSITYGKAPSVDNIGGVLIPSLLLGRLRSTGLAWGAI